MANRKFSALAYEQVDDFIYGRARHPVTTRNGLVIGGGQVYPELNFTLPSMAINAETMPEVRKQYRDILTDACKRARDLFLPGFVAEIELLPPTTYYPSWGIEITKIVRDVLDEEEAKSGLKGAIRLTPVDIREDKHSPHMWHGPHWDAIMETFEGGALAGADFLSIESIGGKDVHDDAILYCELDKSIFALGVLGARDMSRLWSGIKLIADRTGSIAAGDTACGFANTAMVLADRGMVPKVFASVVRVVSAVRSLVAIEEGAAGPHKDCGYEGVYIKAITGTPISLEGKSSACAHLSPVGNIAACVTDLWSNESVQNIKLLGGMAPTVSMEQLIYDCRLMNVAASKGHQHTLDLRNWLAESDARHDPQALVLRPDVVVDISRKIIAEDTPFRRSVVAAQAAVDTIRKAIDKKEVHVEEREIAYLDIMERQIDAIADTEGAFIEDMLVACDSEKFDPKKYDL